MKAFDPLPMLTTVCACVHIYISINSITKKCLDGYKNK